MNDSLSKAIGTDVSRETRAKLEKFAAILVAESARQNLISKSTIDAIWDRHIIDSSQLLSLAPPRAPTWVDIGSGGGLPGLVLACLGARVTLVEPRRLRVEFLRAAAGALDIDVEVVGKNAEKLQGNFDVITARAVARLDRLLWMTRHLSHDGTIWILPKGKNAKSELVEARRNWHCHVREVPSLTSADSTILVISKVKAKRRP